MKSQHFDIVQIRPIVADLTKGELETIDSRQRFLTGRKFAGNVIVSGGGKARTRSALIIDK